MDLSVEIFPKMVGYWTGAVAHNDNAANHQAHIHVFPYMLQILKERHLGYQLTQLCKGISEPKKGRLFRKGSIGVAHFIYIECYIREAWAKQGYQKEKSEKISISKFKSSKRFKSLKREKVKAIWLKE